MNSAEYSLVQDLFLSKMHYYDSNPDVGFGPFPQTVLNDILKFHNLTAKDESKSKILDKYFRSKRM